MELRLLLIGFLLGILPCTQVTATSYIWIGDLAITNSTDVWVHGRALSVNGPTEKTKSDFGDLGYYENLTLTLEIIASTDETIWGTVVIRPEKSHIRHIDAGGDVFAAFRIEEGLLVPARPLGREGWTRINLEDETVRTGYGVVDSMEYWRWLAGIRYAISSGGQASEEDIAYWRGTLDTDDGVRIRLGIAFL